MFSHSLFTTQSFVYQIPGSVKGSSSTTQKIESQEELEPETTEHWKRLLRSAKATRKTTTEEGSSNNNNIAPQLIYNRKTPQPAGIATNSSSYQYPFPPSFSIHQGPSHLNSSPLSKNPLPVFLPNPSSNPSLKLISPQGSQTYIEHNFTLPTQQQQLSLSPEKKQSFNNNSNSSNLLYSPYKPINKSRASLSIDKRVTSSQSTINNQNQQAVQQQFLQKSTPSLSAFPSQKLLSSIGPFNYYYHKFQPTKPAAIIGSTAYDNNNNNNSNNFSLTFKRFQTETKKTFPTTESPQLNHNKQKQLNNSNHRKLVQTASSKIRVRKIEIPLAIALNDSQIPAVSSSSHRISNQPFSANELDENPQKSETRQVFTFQEPNSTSFSTPFSTKNNNPQLQLPSELDRYKIGPQIGKGAYAVVKLATDTQENAKVAIKLYDKYKLTDPQKKKNVQREIYVLKHIQHPNCIEIKKTFETTKSFCVVMEYVGKDSLFSYLRKFDSRKLPEEEAKRIFKQIIKGVSYLHENNIVHRDLKLENLLMDDTNNVKIIDFGFAMCTTPETIHTVFCGTPSYMAPEIVSKGDYFGPPVDVWACGIILFVMLVGHFPFRSPDDKTLYSKIQTGTFEMPDYLSTGAKQILQKLLNVDPQSRATAAEIFQDTWVNPMNICKKIGELKALIQQQRQLQQSQQQKIKGEQDQEEEEKTEENGNNN